MTRPVTKARMTEQVGLRQSVVAQAYGMAIMSQQWLDQPGMILLWQRCRSRSYNDDDDLNWVQGFMVLRNTKPIGSSNICNGQRTNIKRLWSKGSLNSHCHHQSSSGQASSDRIMMWEHLGARWSVVKIFGMFGWVSSTSTLSTQVKMTIVESFLIFRWSPGIVLVIMVNGL